ncbi:MAG: FAD-dependent oxidoreductase [Anaerolineales bacterium]
MKRYVIIGAGAAGIAAAEAIRSRDTAGEIIVLAAEPEGFYSRPGLAYYLNGEIPEKQLMPFGRQDFRKLNITLRHDPARALDPGAHTIHLASGKQLVYDKALIATGASAHPAKVPGTNLKGVVKLDNLSDAREIIKLVRWRKRAVVVGGGITALEIVEGLQARGVRVTYFLRGDRYWGSVLDESESQIVEHRLQEEGVDIHYNTELAEILEKRGDVSGVRTATDKIIPCGIVGIAIGVRPNIQIAIEAGLETDRGILVNPYLQTSDPDVYAAGDVTQVVYPESGKQRLNVLWWVARREGHIAGINMSGTQHYYRQETPFNVTRLAGLTTTIIGSIGSGGSHEDEDLLGIARGDSETWREIPDAIVAQRGFDVNRLRLMVGEKRILGAIVMGDQTLSQPIHHLVSNQVDITPIRDKLLLPQAPLGEIITEFWTTWRQNYAAAQQS